GWHKRQSSSSSPPRTCAPGAAGCFETARSPQTCCSHRPASPHCSRQSKSTGKAIGTAAIPANPTITPLVRECQSKDTVLVQINPVERPGSPRSARDILNRLNEVSFNAVLLKELRMIALPRQVAQPDNSESAKWANMRIHRISSEMMVELGYSSKL